MTTNTPSNALLHSRSGAVTGFKHSLLIVTADTIEGRQVTKVLGLVRGNTIRARHVGRDIMAVFRNMLGGEIKDYTKMMGESREQAIDRLVEQAQALGANAVVAMRFSTSSVMAGASELLAYGTAVVLAPEE